MLSSKNFLLCFTIVMLVGSLIPNHQASASPWIGDHKKDTTNVDRPGRVEHRGRKFGVNAEEAEIKGDMIIEIGNSDAQHIICKPRNNNSVTEKPTMASNLAQHERSEKPSESKSGGGKYIHYGEPKGINIAGQRINGSVRISWGNNYKKSPPGN